MLSPVESAAEESDAFAERRPFALDTALCVCRKCQELLWLQRLKAATAKGYNGCNGCNGCNG